MIHLDQARANHRIQRRLGDAAFLQKRAHRLYLIGLHIDDEAVRCIGWKRSLPAIQQIGAHQGQQQDHHQAEAERSNLRRTGDSATTDIGEAVAPRSAQTCAQLSQHEDQHHRQHGEHQQGDRNADQHRRRQRRRAGLPPQQGAESGQAGEPGQPGADFVVAEITTQYAQCRHAAQSKHRRHREREQDGEADGKAFQRRQPARRRNIQTHDARQPTAERGLNGEAEQDADATADQAQPCQFTDMDDGDAILAGAETAHHRAAIEMTCGMSTRRHRHRDGGQHDTEQGRQSEKTIGAFKR